MVPYEESDTEIFLRTIIPSRKMNKNIIKDLNKLNMKYIDTMVEVIEKFTN